MNSTWYRKLGLTISLVLVFVLQAFLPLSLENFNVSLMKWFFLQSILLVIFLALIFRFANSMDAPDRETPSPGNELESSEFIDPTYLIGAVVHEVRTPLNKLCLLLDKQEELTDGSMIQDTLDELTGLVDHIEDVFRQNALRLQWIPSSVFFARIHEKLEPDAPVKYVIQEDWIYVDPSKLRLTVSNLIQNGLEAYDSSDASVTVVVESVGPEWCIVVRDRAGGMDPETARVISSKGTNHDAESSGMGLGLLIARRIVENHNGRMVVESDPSVGTEITITLPKPRSG